MLLSFVLIFGWQALRTYLDQKHPEWHLVPHPEAATQPVDTTQPVAGSTTGPATTGPTIAIAKAEEARTIELGSAIANDPTYAAEAKAHLAWRGDRCRDA